MQERSLSRRFAATTTHPAWVLTASFGTYFCVYGFRKPYTAATYGNTSFFGLDYKFLLIISQTLGYVIAKWAGIKIVSEIQREQRIKAILILIGFAEFMLLLFGIVPRPWNIPCLFVNGLPLGVTFGLVLGFLEGRRNSEFLIAGLCSSFIVSDGVSKSVGNMLLNARHNRKLDAIFCRMCVRYTNASVCCHVISKTITITERYRNSARPRTDASNRQNILF